MPRRTNTFQQMIRYIYEKMVAKGGRVTESALIRERDGGTEREIDVLLEQDVAGIPVRIALECRRRRCKDDIGWIDCLIGKYNKLEPAIARAVAVSSSDRPCLHGCRGAGAQTGRLARCLGRTPD